MAARWPSPPSCRRPDSPPCTLGTRAAGCSTGPPSASRPAATAAETRPTSRSPSPPSRPGLASARPRGLISRRRHGRPMALPAFLPPSGFAPLHDGHEGGGLFDAYNLGIGAVVLV